MPKTPTPFKLKLSKLTTEFKNEMIEENSGSLFCAACGIMLTGMTKFLVKQHVETGKHKANLVLKSKQTTLTAPKRKDFPAELCEVRIILVGNSITSLRSYKF